MHKPSQLPSWCGRRSCGPERCPRVKAPAPGDSGQSPGRSWALRDRLPAHLPRFLLAPALFCFADRFFIYFSGCCQLRGETSRGTPEHRAACARNLLRPRVWAASPTCACCVVACVESCSSSSGTDSSLSDSVPDPADTHTPHCRLRRGRGQEPPCAGQPVPGTRHTTVFRGRWGRSAATSNTPVGEGHCWPHRLPRARSRRPAQAGGLGHCLLRCHQLTNRGTAVPTYTAEAEGDHDALLCSRYLDPVPFPSLREPRACGKALHRPPEPPGWSQQSKALPQSTRMGPLWPQRCPQLPSAGDGRGENCGGHRTPPCRGTQHTAALPAASVRSQPRQWHPRHKPHRAPCSGTHTVRPDQWLVVLDHAEPLTCPFRGASPGPAPSSPAAWAGSAPSWRDLSRATGAPRTG